MTKFEMHCNIESRQLIEFSVRNIIVIFSNNKVTFT